MTAQLPRQIGRYHLTAQLGAGGLGKVFQGEDEAGTQVAIKVLTNLSERSRARFQRELALGKTLEHPNLVRTLEGGEVAGHPYLVLELVPGEDLSQRMRARGEPLPLDELVALARQLASGLAYLHARGLVHRDLKPENLRLRPDGQLKILDLGLMHDPDTTALTATGTVLGTFLYMSPEQLRGGERSPSMDIYAFGVLLYKLSTGRHPLYGEGSIRLADYLPLPARGDVQAWRPGARTALDPFFRRCLDPDPAARFPDAEALAAAFAEAVADLDRRPGPGSDALADSTLELGRDTARLGAKPAPPTAPVASPGTAGTRRRGLALAALGVASAAVTWLLWPRPPPVVTPIEGLALSPEHRVLVLESDRPTELFLGVGGPAVPRGANGRTHFVAIGPEQDSVRLAAAGEVELPPRSLSEQRWRPLTWDAGGTLTWRGEALPLPEDGLGGAWPRALPTTEDLLRQLARAVIALDVSAWIFEAQATSRRLGRLAELLEERGVVTLHGNTAEVLLERLADLDGLAMEDVELWYAAHDLCLAEAFLHRAGVASPIDPLKQGLYDHLVHVETYTLEDRPPPRPGRRVLAKQEDFFLPELPNQRRDAVADIVYVAPKPAVLPLPPGTEPLYLDAVITRATSFAHDYFGLFAVDGTRPVFFFEDPTGPGGQVARESAMQGDRQLRRRFRIPVPRVLLGTPITTVDVRFRPWTWDQEQRFDVVFLQAYGWTREAP